jgi:hypothetical protein
MFVSLYRTCQSRSALPMACSRAGGRRSDLCQALLQAARSGPSGPNIGRHQCGGRAPIGWGCSRVAPSRPVLAPGRPGGRDRKEFIVPEDLGLDRPADHGRASESSIGPTAAHGHEEAIGSATRELAGFISDGVHRQRKHKNREEDGGRSLGESRPPVSYGSRRPVACRVGYSSAKTGRICSPCYWLKNIGPSGPSRGIGSGIQDLCPHSSAGIAVNGYGSVT